jgi:hypothetical protein
MSDYYQILVDVDADEVEAKSIATNVLKRFRAAGLIASRPNGHCVLGGTGYPPGPKMPKLYELEYGSRFWELATNGVEVRIGRGFNESALGPACDGFRCPSCGTEFDPFASELGTTILAAAAKWRNGLDKARVRCPNCKNLPLVTQWECKPPIGFGNLAFGFWNWPPFSSTAWKLDIVSIVHDDSGHKIVSTFGHV